MKNILEEFMKDQKKTLKKSYDWDYKPWLKEKYPDEDIEAHKKFLNDEKVRVKKRDQDYEKSRVKKTVTFTKDEFDQIEEQRKISGVDFNKFARSAILKKKIKLPIEQDLIIELSRIGNNLNQIAKATNSRDDKVQILTQLVEIEKQLKELKK